MKRKRFTEEQIISILREREAGMPVQHDTIWPNISGSTHWS